MSQLQALLFVAAVVAGFLFYLGWYRLKTVLQRIKESSAALTLILRTKLELTHQAMAACRSRADEEKLAGFQVTRTTTATMEELAKSNMRAEQAMAYCEQLASRFPELKDGRFTQLQSQIEQLDSQLNARRAEYNRQVDNYNLARTTIPMVIVARALKFPAATGLNLRNWMISFTPQK